MHFKTIEGARKRAKLETAYSNSHDYHVVPNDNTHQVAQGYAWRLKKVKRGKAVTVDALFANPKRWM